MNFGTFIKQFDSNKTEIDIYNNEALMVGRRLIYGLLVENNKDHIGFYDTSSGYEKIVKFDFDSQIELGTYNNILVTDILGRKLELYFFKMELVNPVDYFSENKG